MKALMATLKCFIISCLFSPLYTYPEESFLNTTVPNDTVVQISKCMKMGVPVYVKVYCETNVDVRIAWLLSTSPCLNGFSSSTARIFFMSSSLPVLKKREDSYTYKYANETISCTPFAPILLMGKSAIHPINHAGIEQRFPGGMEEQDHAVLSKTWTTGVYLFAMQVSCAPKTCSPPIRVIVEMKNENGGHLSPLDFPYLPFSGTMTGVYSLLGITWFVFVARFWRQLTKIQVYTGVLLLLGLWENVTLTAVYATIENTGTMSMTGLYLAELLSCIRRTLGRVLLLIVCLGYGVTQSNLGRLWFRRCLQLGLAYFILLTVEGMARISQPRFHTSLVVFFALVPLVIMDAFFMIWIIIHLSRSLRATRVRYHPVKYRLYRTFSGLLIALYLTSLAFAVYSSVYLKRGDCIEHWEYLWLDEAYWHVLFVVFMMAVMVLWRPSAMNRLYAYSLLDQIDSDSEDPAEVDVLFDQSELQTDSQFGANLGPIVSPLPLLHLISADTSGNHTVT